MKPIIGIVGRTNRIKNNKYNIFVNDNHRRAVIESGGIPISILPTQNIKYEQKDNKKENSPLNEEEQEDVIRVIEKCDGIILQGGNYSYYYDEFIARYSIENDITLVAVVENKIIGYLIGSLNTQNSYNKTIQAELDNMCILEEYRKLGIGSKLFNKFKEICKENDINELKVVASYNNKNAINFYKKNGFEEAEITL